jgi:DNA-binding FadR family transcriptional regulator
MSLNDLVRMVDGAVRLEYGAALHVHEVRAMIEITSARLAAARRTDADLIAMQETIERYRVHHAPTDSEVLISADLDFHRSVVEATHNEMMVQLLGSISGLLREHRRQYVTPTAQGIHDVVVEQHEGIYEAIVSGDPRLAAAKMQEHMRNIWSQIEELAIREGDASIGGESYLPMYED